MRMVNKTKEAIEELIVMKVMIEIRITRLPYPEREIAVCRRT